MDIRLIFPYSSAVLQASQGASILSKQGRITALSGGICLVLLMQAGHALLTGGGAYGPAGLIQDIHPPARHPGSLAVAHPVNAQQRLRILHVPHTPAGDADSVERKLLAEYASGEQLQTEWVEVPDDRELLPALLRGDGDVVISVRNAADPRLVHTLPWGISTQELVGRADSNRVTTLDQLTVRQIALKKTSSAWPLLSALAEQHAGMELIEIPQELEADDILARVSSGRYELAVVDRLRLPGDMNFRYNLQVFMSLSEESFMSWGLRADAVELHNSMNKFLNQKHLELESAARFSGDLATMKQRKQLRLITMQGPVSYFHDRGRLKGFEYELIRKFADLHGMRVDVIVAGSHEEAIRLLRRGVGDIVAAALPESRYRHHHEIKISAPYNYAAPVLVGREGEVIVDLRDLEGRTIHLAAGSPYRGLLEKIRGLGINVTIAAGHPGLNIESVLFRISQGLMDLTVIGSHEAKAELAAQMNLKAHISLGDPQPLVWAVRRSNTRTLAALNEYIEGEYRKGFYNVLHARYIDNPVSRRGNPGLLSGLDELSPYDDIVKRYADLHSFDWRLIVAQMYQESLFDPGAVSYAGAEGLMQLLPGTAEMIGVADLNDPVSNIQGGIYYMDYLRGMFEAELSLEDRTWFTLASYNAGYYRVRRARELAEEMGLDSNRWFDNVEIAMLHLAQPYLRDGLVVRECRCGQTVVYVREIRTLYNNYLGLTQSARAAARLWPEGEES